ncbi:MAG: hypothetical protein AAF744_07850 [Pseudomonadota bacterium]
MKRSLPLLLLLMIGLPAGLFADSFTVQLGQRALGGLTLTQTQRGEITLNMALDNTPLRVFDGQFKGRSTPTGAKARRYVGFTQTRRKQLARTITLSIAEGSVTDVEVAPASERTALSVLSAVPAGVIDPAAAFAALANASGCPSTLRVYDGRRVIEMRAAGRSGSAEAFSCAITYSVVAGPAHLSPLGIKRAAMTASYAVSGGAQRLRAITIRAAGFEAVIARKP